VSETEEAFHGYPSLQVQYEGQQDNRVIKGRDIWVLSPKARWLINMEGDVSLYNAIAAPYDQILNGMEFI
jgi:hypothetical protein